MGASLSQNTSVGRSGGKGRNWWKIIEFQILKFQLHCGFSLSVEIIYTHFRAISHCMQPFMFWVSSLSFRATSVQFSIKFRHAYFGILWFCIHQFSLQWYDTRYLSKHQYSTALLRLAPDSDVWGWCQSLDTEQSVSVTLTTGVWPDSWQLTAPWPHNQFKHNQPEGINETCHVPCLNEYNPRRLYRRLWTERYNLLITVTM